MLSVITTQRCSLLFLVTLLIVAVAVGTTLNMNQLGDLHHPIIAAPLISSRVLADVNHIVSNSPDHIEFSNTQIQSLSTGFSDLNTLSSLDIQMTSTTPPQHESSLDFFPFGRHMSLSFALPPQSATENGVLAEDDYNFLLEIDENIISTDPESPTTSFISQSIEDSVQHYSKHTSFKGKRVNSNGKEEFIYLSIIPTTTLGTSPSPGLETLSLDDQITGYTYEAVFLSNNKLYHITSYESLLTQLSTQHAKIHEEITTQTSGNPQNNTIQATFDILSANIAVLTAQRALSVDDLVIREVPVNSLGTDNTKCGNEDHQHDEAHDDDVVALHGEDDLEPIAQQSMWTLSTWKSSCHPRMNTITIFSVKLYLSTKYRMWASDASTEASISNTKVEARTKLVQSLSNHIFYAQMRIFYSIGAYVHAPSTQTAAWNDEVTCSFSKALSAIVDIRITDFAQSISHVLWSCVEPSSSGGYTAGLATLGGPGHCSQTLVQSAPYGNYGGAGVSRVAALGHFTTYSHEVGHTLNAYHTFDSKRSNPGPKPSKQGGGLMDYSDSIILSSVDPGNDAGHIGYSKYFHENEVCAYLTTLMTGTGTPSKFVGTDKCWKGASSVYSAVCDNDGLIKPWQQCQGSTCCTDCKISAGATCLLNNECCVNCRLPTVPTLCTYGGVKNAGFCGSAGDCIALACSSSQPAGRTAKEYFTSLGSNTWQNACERWCVSSSGSFSTTSEVTLGLGNSCYLNTGATGQCFVNSAKSTGLECLPLSDSRVVNIPNSYTWDYVILQEGSCSPKVPYLDAYVCRNQEGSALPDDACAGKTKPPQKQLTCMDTIDTVTLNATSYDQGSSVTVTWAFTQASDASTPTTATFTVFNGSSEVAQVLTKVPLAAKTATFPLPATMPTTTSGSIKIVSSTGLSVQSDFFNVYSYSWTTGSYATCSASFCGTGVSLRPVTCTRNDGAASAASKCPSSSKPVAEQACTATNNSCGNGICTNNKCTCNAGYSGDRCTTQFCSSCVTSNTENCVNSALTCPCKAGFVGATCAGTLVCTLDENTKAKDPSKCSNDGWIVQGSNAACGARCLCPNKWTSADQTPTVQAPGCNICSLECNTATRQGMPDSTCTECKCGDSFFSQQCQCRQLMFTLNFLQYPVSVKAQGSSEKFATYMLSSTRDAAIVTEVNSFFTKIEQIYANMARINKLRFAINSWTMSGSKLVITTRVRGLCSTDTSIIGFKSITDTTPSKYTQQEHLYNIVETILAQFKSFNSDRIDGANIGTIATSSSSITETKTLGQKVIYDPGCSDAQMKSGEYTCKMSESNNAISSSITFWTLISVAVLVFLF